MQALTVIDVVVETMRMGGFLKDAAARVGVDVNTLRDWRTKGSRCLIELNNGRRRRSQMSQHERNCMTMVLQMDEAEAEARTALLMVTNQLARGGHKRTETTTETDAVGNITKSVTREIEVAPDSHAAAWLLSHRWPADFGATRVEVTGADGGPIKIDDAPLIDRIRAHIADIRDARAESEPAALETMLSGTNGSNGNGDGHNA
jgi:hypothetical protein